MSRAFFRKKGLIDFQKVLTKKAIEANDFNEIKAKQETSRVVTIAMI